LDGQQGDDACPSLRQEQQAETGLREDRLIHERCTLAATSASAQAARPAPTHFLSRLSALVSRAIDGVDGTPRDRRAAANASAGHSRISASGGRL